MNPLKELSASGQAVWLDFVQRSLLTSGGLQRLLDQDGVTGVTSNPAIFQKAIGDSDDYDDAIRQMTGQDATSIYEALAIDDIRLAADQLWPVYEHSAAKDGYVSLEVSPFVADDLAGTLAEARRLWARVDRPNLMIKIPGTSAGIAAIRPLVAEGVNINVTLLFAVSAYFQAALAYMAGLEDRLAGGRPIDRVASVASFFISRIDTRIDALLDARSADASPELRDTLASLKGQAAIANAAVAYRRFQHLLNSSRWSALAAANGQPQRLLWASTGVKDPAYPDTLYTASLVAPLTVNTLPPGAMDAFRDHGRISSRLASAAGSEVVGQLNAVGVNLNAVTDALLQEGLSAFSTAMAELTAAVDDKTNRLARRRA